MQLESYKFPSEISLSPSAREGLLARPQTAARRAVWRAREGETVPVRVRDGGRKEEATVHVNTNSQLSVGRAFPSFEKAIKIFFASKQISESHQNVALNE